jgi:hypothetical protein
MKHFILSFALMLLIIACQKQGSQQSIVSVNTENVEEIRIDIDKGPFYPLDSIFTANVKFVRLETTDDNLIGKVSNILISDSLIFVVDKEQTYSIFIFDKTGHYITKIANRGNGPGEYSRIYDVVLMPNEHQIAVISPYQWKTIFYSYSGNFVKEEKYVFPCISRGFLESGNKVYYHQDNIPEFNNGTNTVIVTDKNNKGIYNACFEYHSDYFYYSVKPDFSQFGNALYFYPDYQDTIYQITDTAAIAKYYLNVLKHKFSHPQDIENITNEIWEEEYLDKHPYFNGKYIEMKDYTYLVLLNSVAATQIQVIYSHKNKRTCLITHSFYNFLYQFYGMDTMLPITRIGDNGVVVPVWSHILLNYKQSLYDVPELIKDFSFNNIPVEQTFLDSLYLNMDEEDNPVLFFYEIKPDL